MDHQQCSRITIDADVFEVPRIDPNDPAVVAQLKAKEDERQAKAKQAKLKQEERDRKNAEDLANLPTEAEYVAKHGYSPVTGSGPRTPPALTYKPVAPPQLFLMPQASHATQKTPAGRRPAGRSRRAAASSSSSGGDSDSDSPEPPANRAASTKKAAKRRRQVESRVRAAVERQLTRQIVNPDRPPPGHPLADSPRRAPDTSHVIEVRSLLGVLDLFIRAGVTENPRAPKPGELWDFTSRERLDVEPDVASFLDDPLTKARLRKTFPGAAAEEATTWCHACGNDAAVEPADTVLWEGALACSQCWWDARRTQLALQREEEVSD